MKKYRSLTIAKFWLALGVATYFYSLMDILIWQRIFEKYELWDIGVGVYHRGQHTILLGIMVVAAILLIPDWHLVISFPISLWLFMSAGVGDVLYYWLDGRALPAELPWLSGNWMLLQPVTGQHLVLSAAFWVALVIAANLLVNWLVKGGNCETTVTRCIDSPHVGGKLASVAVQTPRRPKRVVETSL